MTTTPDGLEAHPALRSDCASCAGLCCVFLAFARSSDFPFDKPADEPCRNLLADHRCGVHGELRERGFRGCTVFECHGAGQRVTQEIAGGVSWQDDPAVRTTMAAVFPVMRQLHELLALLDEAARLVASGRVDGTRPVAEGAVRDGRAPGLQAAIVEATAAVDRAASAGPDQVPGTDVDALRDRIAPVLRAVATQVTGSAPRGVRRPGRIRPGADLVEARLGGQDLRGADLRGALCLGADLSGTDLRDAVLLGADLRGADLSGADLSTAVFLTQPQCNAASGSDTTRLPPGVERPTHWR